MSNNDDVLKIYTHKEQSASAHIVLNGYNVDAGSSFGAMGKLRSFKIVTGDLWEEWNAQKALTLRDKLGNEAKVRIAALPVEDEGYGLIEFLQ